MEGEGTCDRVPGHHGSAARSRPAHGGSGAATL